MGEKRLYLTWRDILVLTLILFGRPIYDSTVAFLSPVSTNLDLSATSDWSIYYSIVTQGLSLLIALLYLIWRRFDFSQWTITYSPRAIFIALGLFWFIAGVTDVYNLIFSPEHRLFYLQASFHPDQVLSKLLMPVSLPGILYALLNGVYEELFFIGLCLSVKNEQKYKVWLYSLLVRTAFHTYQGLLSAVGIGLILGITYFIWYEKLNKRNLFPIFLSHAFADIWGLAILYYLFG